MKAPRELLVVARRLGELQGQSVFVGGMVRGLLITDAAVVGARQTKDVDLVVDVADLADYYALCERLRERGFLECAEPGAPLCRWIVDEILVDVMPTDPAVLGFSNVWYPDALRLAPTLEIDGMPLRVIDPVHFCATKLEAWLARGDDDLWHHDLEDVVALVDGCPALVDALTRAASDVRGFVGRVLADLLARADFLDALPGHLAPDDASQARLPLLLRRLRAIAALREVTPVGDVAAPDEPGALALEDSGPTAAPLQPGAVFPWTAVRSSNLRAVRYEPGSLELSIEFRSGHVYTYVGVPRTVFDALMAAGSKGAFLARWIKNRYRYRRVR